MRNGVYNYAVIFTVILCFLMIILNTINFGVPKRKTMKFKIIVPEDLNYEEVFNELLKNYN